MRAAEYFRESTHYLQTHCLTFHRHISIEYQIHWSGKRFRHPQSSSFESHNWRRPSKARGISHDDLLTIVSTARSRHRSMSNSRKQILNLLRRQDCTDLSWCRSTRSMFGASRHQSNTISPLLISVFLELPVGSLSLFTLFASHTNCGMLTRSADCGIAQAQ